MKAIFLKVILMDAATEDDIEGVISDTKIDKMVWDVKWSGDVFAEAEG